MHDHPDNHEHDTSCGHVTGGEGHNVVTPHKKRAHSALMWTGVLAGSSHLFCCVLPGIFSVLALLSSFGIIITLPGWLEQVHDVMHEWELYVIGFSGVIVAIGWGSYFYSRYNDCHSHGCDHGSCQPRKKRAGRILLLASALFIVNVTVYFGLHAQENTHNGHAHAEHEHDH